MVINCLIKNNNEEEGIFHAKYKDFWNFFQNVLCFHPKVYQLLQLRTKRLHWKISAKIVIFLEGLRQKKCSAGKNKLHREPALMENIHQSYQGFNSYKSSLSSISSACQLLTPLILLFVLALYSLICFNSFLGVSRRLCSVVPASRGFPQAAAETFLPSLPPHLFFESCHSPFLHHEVMLCLSIQCLSATEPPATSPTLPYVFLCTTAPTSVIAPWTFQLSTSHQK